MTLSLDKSFVLSHSEVLNSEAFKQLEQSLQDELIAHFKIAATSDSPDDLSTVEYLEYLRSEKGTSLSSQMKRTFYRLFLEDRPDAEVSFRKEKGATPPRPISPTSEGGPSQLDAFGRIAETLDNSFNNSLQTAETLYSSMADIGMKSGDLDSALKANSNWVSYALGKFDQDPYNLINLFGLMKAVRNLDIARMLTNRCNDKSGSNLTKEQHDKYVQCANNAIRDFKNLKDEDKNIWVPKLVSLLLIGEKSGFLPNADVAPNQAADTDGP